MNKIIFLFTITFLFFEANYGFCHFGVKEEYRFIKETLPYVYGLRQTELNDYKNRKLKVWSMDVPAKSKDEEEHVMVLVEDVLSKKGCFSYLNKKGDWWTNEVSWSTDIEFLNDNNKYRTVDALWGFGTEKKIESLINKILKTKPRYYSAGRSSNVEINLNLLDVGEKHFDKASEAQALEWFIENNEIYGLGDAIVQPEKLKVFSSLINYSIDNKDEQKKGHLLLTVLILRNNPDGTSAGTFFAIDQGLAPEKRNLVLSAKANVGNNPNAGLNNKDGFEIINGNNEFTIIGDAAIIKAEISSFLKQKPNLYQVTKKVEYSTSIKNYSLEKK